ncbi:MAG TPA: hypothetical protein VEF55_12405 [Candidatus Binatia bacterium]|nr:hypothetical protein [Candidatus Binatia bacterium]
MRREADPYAPPPRHKERSGGVVRLAVIAALLGAAAWGYMEYSQQPQTALVEPAAEERTLADQSYDSPTAQPAAPAAGSPQATTPAEVPEKAAEPPA